MQIEHYNTFFVWKHHDAISVSVSIKLSCNDVTIFSKNIYQFFIIVFSHCRGALWIRQIPHWNMSYDVHLEEETQRGLMRICTFHIYYNHWHLDTQDRKHVNYILESEYHISYLLSKKDEIYETINGPIFVLVSLKLHGLWYKVTVTLLKKNFNIDRGQSILKALQTKQNKMINNRGKS